MKNVAIASIEVESAIIGGLLLDNSKFDEISMLIQPNDFYAATHKVLFKGIAHLLQAGQPVDILTLEQYLKSLNIDKEIGLGLLADIVKNTPSASNITRYAQIVARYAKQRSYLKLGQFITSEMQSPKDDVDLEKFEEQIDKQYTDISTVQSSVESADLKTSFARILTRMEKSAANGNPVSGTPTGITELDEITTGGQPGELIIVSARPSMGKTTFAQVIANSTLEAFPEKSIQFYSQEMPADQLLERFLSMRARINMQSIRQANHLDDMEWEKLTIAMAYIVNNWNNRLIIDDEASLTPHRLRTKVRRNTRLYGAPKAIFIDYIQLMRTHKKFENRNLELAEISSELKKLAKETGCPVYALSQLNRSLEQRANKRPVNSDLRDSGSLEQDADVILHLYRDEVYYPDTEYPGIAEIIIGKQRNGPLATINAKFLGQYSTFENMN